MTLCVTTFPPYVIFETTLNFSWNSFMIWLFSFSLTIQLILWYDFIMYSVWLFFDIFCVCNIEINEINIPFKYFFPRADAIQIHSSLYYFSSSEHWEEFFLISCSHRQVEVTIPSWAHNKLYDFIMKIFQSFQKNSAYVGIISNPTPQNHSFNPRNVMCLASIGFASISNIFYLFNAAGQLTDNMYSVYMASMTIGVFSVYSIVIWKMTSLFKFIDGIGNAINISKWNWSCTKQFEIFFLSKCMKIKMFQEYIVKTRE